MKKNLKKHFNFKDFKNIFVTTVGFECNKTQTTEMIKQLIYVQLRKQMNPTKQDEWADFVCKVYQWLLFWKL